MNTHPTCAAAPPPRPGHGRRRGSRPYLALAAARLVPALLLVSCAGTPRAAIEHRAYPKTPDDPSTVVWRALAKSNPWTGRAAFHGNWGGSGNAGGPPVDLIDEGCRRHDIVYYEARSARQLRAADRCLVGWLESVEESDLTEDQLAFRRRAIGFMNSPVATIAGKPVTSLFRTREDDTGYFKSPEVVEAFFDPNHPGFPEPSPQLPVELRESRSFGAGGAAGAGVGAKRRPGRTPYRGSVGRAPRQARRWLLGPSNPTG